MIESLSDMFGFGYLFFKLYLGPQYLVESLDLLEVFEAVIYDLVNQTALGLLLVAAPACNYLGHKWLPGFVLQLDTPSSVPLCS